MKSDNAAPKGSKNDDLEELSRCEEILRLGKVHFISMGEALLTIKGRRLYKVTHRTFKEYCTGRWDLSESHCDYLMVCAKTARALPSGSKTPSKASQMAALQKVEGDVVRSLVWDKAVRDASGAQPTIRQITESAEEVLGRKFEWTTRASPYFFKNLDKMADRVLDFYSEAEVNQLISLLCLRMAKQKAA